MPLTRILEHDTIVALAAWLDDNVEQAGAHEQAYAELLARRRGGALARAARAADAHGAIQALSGSAEAAAATAAAAAAAAAAASTGALAGTARAANAQ